MDKYETTGSPPEGGRGDACCAVEREIQSLRCLIGDLLKTNQQLRDALRDSDRGRSELAGETQSNKEL